MNSQGKATVFLDRDGVLNHCYPNQWVTHVRDCVVLPGVPEAVAALNRAGYRTVVVTNQRGLAIGRLTWSQLNQVHKFLTEKVAEAGGQLTEYFICPHDRDDACGCRKPKAGLLDAANHQEAVDWSASYMVGDRVSDIGAGKARNLITIRVDNESAALLDQGKTGPSPDFVVESLGQAVELILGRACPPAQLEKRFP